MPLSWNEIKRRAIGFAREWADTSDERAQAQSFWIDFFAVFGLSPKRLASFEHALRKHGGAQGFVDLFWPGVLVVEHKSRGRSLDRAFGQALDEFPAIAERVAFLFERYQALTSLLLATPAKRQRRTAPAG